jgi:hypothetical protein
MDSNDKTPEQLAAEQAAVDQAAADAAKAAGKKRKARVLVDCQYGKCNDLAEVTAAEGKHGAEHGLLDLDKASIAYAESLA